MEFFSLRSVSTLTPSLPSSSLLRRFGIEKSAFFSGQAVSFPRSSKSCLDSRNLRHGVIGSTQDTAGTVRKTIEVIKQEMSSKDVDLAFVAGATGRVGSRTVRELLKLGFHVRAGVRSAQRAETLVQSVRQMKLGNVIGSSGIQPIETLEIVECDLENQSGITPAIGKASIVICCIGASEKEVFDVTGPYRIDYRATKNLIDAATFAKVDHFILLTSLGTNKIGFPAAILNLFWGVLIWKRKAEEALIASGLPYTIVRPGGMERPTDAYKETHNLVLANEDTLFGGQVSNLQVAELMACMAKNRRLSYCKVVEVIAETTVPLTPMEELLAKIPSQRELPTELDSEPVPPSIDSKSTMSVIEEKPIQKKEPQIRPLSPYTMYDDLKPPSSPSPTPSTTPSGTQQKQVDAVQAKPESELTSTSPEEVTEKDPERAQTAKPSPLSPYMAYEDLKPPTTPSPTPKSASSGSKEKVLDATSPLESN